MNCGNIINTTRHRLLRALRALNVSSSCLVCYTLDLIRACSSPLWRASYSQPGASERGLRHPAAFAPAGHDLAEAGGRRVLHDIKYVRDKARSVFGTGTFLLPHTAWGHPTSSSTPLQYVRTYVWRAFWFLEAGMDGTRPSDILKTRQHETCIIYGDSSWLPSTWRLTERGVSRRGVVCLCFCVLCDDVT